MSAELTCGSFFSGTGGSDMGAMRAGFIPKFGVEFSPKVADCYRANVGNHIIVADVRQVNPHSLPYVDWFMASPPCQGHSKARDHKRMGQRDDLDFSHEIVSYIMVRRPRWVMVENVVGYRHTDSARHIIDNLIAMGYSVTEQTARMEYHGVPQSRHRYIILASRDGLAPILANHERDESQWADATNRATVYGLPATKLYPSQSARLGEIDEATAYPAIVDGQNTGRQNWTVRGCLEPMFTVTATCWKAMPKLIMDREHTDIRQVTPELLARLAGFFPSFIVPSEKKLACHVIGNAVPPMFTMVVGRLLKHFG